MADIFNMLDTWTDSGTTYTSIKMNATDTASAAGTLLMDLQVGGTSRFNVSKAGSAVFSGQLSSGTVILSGGGGAALNSSGVGIASAAALNFSSTTSSTGTPDTILARDAANTLAQRNGTNAQAFRVEGSFTDTSNRRGVSLSGGTSTAAIVVYGIGTQSAADGILALLNSAGTSFNRLQFGGTTSSFPSIARSSAEIRIRLADDSGYANLRAKQLRLESASLIGDSSDGIIIIANNAQTDFTRLQFGGTSNSFGAIARDGAGISIVGGAGGSTAHIKVPGVTVANLPAAATAGAGARSFVTDALAPTFGSAVTGGGAVNVPVYSTGSAWNVG